MKENDIRPENLMKLKQPAIEHDKKYLINRFTSFVNVNCPGCSSSATDLWATKDLFKFEKCSMCRTIFMNPRPTQEILKEFYTQSKNYEYWNKYIFPTTESTRKNRVFKPRLRKIIQICKRYNIENGALLEVGSAFGTFCSLASAANFFSHVIAVEPTPDLALTCRKQGLFTIENTVENLDLKDHSVDVIVNFEVIEHLFDPAFFLRQSSRLLRPGGLFICTCPNGEGLDIVLLKERSPSVNHEHINYFNPYSIEILLRKNGLRLLEVSTPGELDVDILNNAYKKDASLLSGQVFFKHLLENTSEKTKANFQLFLKNNNLSSHMWAVAIKV